MKAASSKKRLQISKELWRLVPQYFAEAHAARTNGKLVGWMPPMNGAIEVFRAMDIVPVMPENWSPVCAATGLAPECMEAAERMGYSRDLCGYLRNAIGYIHEGMKKPDQPLGGLPAPDLIVAFGGGCIPAMKIFQAFGEHFKVPTYIADGPQIPPEDITDEVISFATERFWHFIHWLEELSGKKLDLDRLTEVVRLSDRACELWDEIMDYRRFVPTPFSAAEIGVMFVMVVLPGTQEAVDFLEKFKHEVKERTENGIGCIPEERFRLFWDNIPLWYNMGLFNYFEKFGAVVVAETYSAAWSIRLDPDKPIESLVRKSMLSFPLVSNVSLKKRIDLVLDACRKYKIDGAILHSNKSCKPISLGQMDLKRALMETLEVPSVVFEADHMDVRNWNDAQVKNRLDAFMDMLEQRKFGGKPSV
ncbi:MAG: 2-hydroxyacyl-CoA dehydratase [Candidatus Abyssobacteria bacterium SURF_17]|jgi:benzoyl-CoA reductase/2-hydroxyglutaryl-CoA dehydratase subunit BcrC/BadD/HgdB|uniref:2-hydroxyacyl-CoA dehydratase n=1 Tax=Candidatus Abyssobacteria bacterium SURF_17 TaxID=2093361 RepID=A0A419EUQ3_9BACT|nr:MAG: 2-hydroxyacyl-CoA dehydratase [Candidatus Abyssubacteria bacterium SURF_17]